MSFEIPDPEEYIKKFWERNHHLRGEALSLAKEHLKPFIEERDKIRSRPRKGQKNWEK